MRSRSPRRTWNGKGGLRVKDPLNKRMLRELRSEMGKYAVIAILLAAKPLSLLVLSQVILSMQLPFTLIPLILLVSNRSLMGELVAPRHMLVMAWSSALLIIALNLWFLFSDFIHA